MKKVRFIISFNLNLFFHLEVISGSVRQRFNKKYALKYPEFSKIAKEFRWEFDSQTISWNFKKRIEKPNAFERGGIEFGRKIKKIYQKAVKLYKPYWEHEIEEKLKRFKEELKGKREWIEEIIRKIEKFTGRTFKKVVNIYLVEALSQEYGIGAEPLTNGIAIGRIKDPTLLKLIITHELVHLNLMNKVIRIVPLHYRKDETKINEAIADLITYQILNVPLPKKLKNPYIKLFQDYFRNAKDLRDFEKLFRKILITKN